MTKQLAFDGSEHPVVSGGGAHGAAPPPLTPGQREILRVLGENDTIRSVEAGVIVHEQRGYCAPHGARSMRRTLRRRDNTIGCCDYAAPDGLEAMKRLMKRGFARRVDGERGLWERA